MVPSFLSYIIASLTLSIPGMILSETGLSFIGLGLRPPAISWGVLLQEAQNLRSLVLAPWVLTPAIAVIITVLCLNFIFACGSIILVPRGCADTLLVIPRSIS
jgi:peptide/nickel transport system permease protein